MKAEARKMSFSRLTAVGVEHLTGKEMSAVVPRETFGM